MSMMNPVRFTLALLATTALGFAQATPATPTTGTTTTGSTSAKPKPFGSTDKTFVKNAGESLYFLINISDKAKRGGGSDASKTLGTKIVTELNKMYGDIGGLATSAGEQMPNELKGSDKTNSGKLGKEKDASKFDAEYFDLAGKELKKLNRYLETGAKMVQNAELKAAAEKWAPAMKGFEDEVEKAAKEAKKK
jgi:predicted outer membrane protein